MKLVTYLSGDVERLGALEDDHIVDLSEIAPDMTSLIRTGKNSLEKARRVLAASQRPERPLTSGQLLSPLPRPLRVLGVGRNYPAHANEAGVGRQEKPRIFVKLSTSVIGSGAVIQRPSHVSKMDYEIELAVVIGRQARDLAREEALDAVYGYTIANDVSARELQLDVSPPQTSFGKSSDGFCPLGPAVVPREEMDWQGLRMRTWVNGELRQDDTTESMIFDVPTIISHVSGIVSLDAGDVILTGTPAGVGAFQDPPRYLDPGDTIAMEIEGIGRLVNTIG
ncbi:MAG: fumarylacetoacetate hydrolase family protein [Azospirillaceae bacterium]